MKEATGEMTTTIIVILGLAAVLVLGTTVVWPAIERVIEQKTTEITETDYDPSAGFVEIEDSYNI